MSLVRFLCLSLVLSLFFPVAIAKANTENKAQLERVVILASDGVRAPTAFEKRLQQMDPKRDWMEWSVGAGRLTTRGKALLRVMGRILGRELEAYNLLPKDGHYEPSMFYLRSDRRIRAQESLRALMSGITPNFQYHYVVPVTTPDPLLYPLRTGICRLDPSLAATDVVKALPKGSLEGLYTELSSELALLDGLLSPVAPELCERFNLPNCRISEMPTSVSIRGDGNGVMLTGGLGIASGFAEIFLMEYSQGPGNKGNWNYVRPDEIGKLWNIRTLSHNAVFRAPYIAKITASALLNAIINSISASTPFPEINQARVIIFMGHEQNIGTISGLTGFSWTVPGIAAFAPVLPGTALVFKVWNIPQTNKKEVSVHLLSYTPVGLHQPDSVIANAIQRPNQNLDLLYIPVLDQFGSFVSMPLDEFMRSFNALVNTDCIPKYRNIQQQDSQTPLPSETQIPLFRNNRSTH